ncbi:MAG TPA: GcrA family cell cycle regulator [Dongiaceae bacterium]|jgi:GcrA cell cycle regulator
MEWTEQRIEILRKLWGQGQTASQIAAILGGITRNAVIGKAHRLGLTGRPSPIKREAGVAGQPRRRNPAPARRLPIAGQTGQTPGQPHGQPLPQTHGVSAAQAQRAQVQAEPVRGASEMPAAAPVKTAPARTASQVGSKTCSWPVGDPKQPGFHFCDEPAEVGKPYCSHHCHVAYHKKSEAA